MNITKKTTYNSPLRIMSHMTRTCPWRQTAKKIPAIANRANIFFRASGPAFFHRSTQVFRHLAKSSCSKTFSHATSSELRSSCPLGSEWVSGGGSTAVGWVEVLWRGGTERCWTGDFWEGCSCYMVNETQTKISQMEHTFFTSSLNVSTSSGDIQRGEAEERVSVRTEPARNALSISLRELLPSMAAKRLNLSGGSFSTL